MHFPGALREPLVQFLIIGACLAGLYALLPESTRENGADGGQEIVITAAEVDGLRQYFVQTWQRAPTEGELAGLIEGLVRIELLYRAGSDLGLAEDDPVVRRRVVQKMEAMLAPLPSELTADEEDLEAHFAAHRERFKQPGRVTFEQVFYERPDAPEDATPSLETFLAALEAGEDPAELGDLSLIPATFSDELASNLARIFGTPFAQSVFAAPLDTWVGPLDTAYGLHFVRVSNRAAPRDPPLAEVRDAVLTDWLSTEREAIAQVRFDELKGRFTITVEMDDALSAEPRPAETAEEALDLLLGTPQ